MRQTPGLFSLQRSGDISPSAMTVYNISHNQLCNNPISSDIVVGSKNYNSLIVTMIGKRAWRIQKIHVHETSARRSLLFHTSSLLHSHFSPCSSISPPLSLSAQLNARSYGPIYVSCLRFPFPWMLLGIPPSWILSPGSISHLQCSRISVPTTVYQDRASDTSPF